MVRIDNLIISVTSAEYDNGLQPDPAVADRLTSGLVSRVQAAKDSGASAGPCLPDTTAGLGSTLVTTPAAVNAPHMPGLDRCVLRLADDQLGGIYGRYLALDGVAIRFYVDTDADLAAYQADITEAGIQEAYRIGYPVFGPNGRSNYGVRIQVFTSEQAAASNVATVEERLEDPGFATVSFERGSLNLGDESYSYVEINLSDNTVATVSAVRIDNIVVTVNVSGMGEPIPDAVDSLMRAQVACMEANDCATPIPVPPALRLGIRKGLRDKRRCRSV